MNRKQALSLLALIADLYAIVNTPEPTSEPENLAAMNGKGQVRQTEPVITE